MYDPVSDAMKRQAYGNSLITFDEHVVRALTIRIARRELGEQASEKLRQNELAAGFIYLPTLLDSLARFENEREKYSSLATFYPTLIEDFAASAAN